MRRSTWMIALVLILLSGGSAQAETQVGTNLFFLNGTLFARGGDGRLGQFSFDGGANLLFGNQAIPDSNPIVDQILGFYCRTLGRTVASSLRFRFFARAIGSRLNRNGAQSCLNQAQNIVNNAPNSPVKTLFQNILGQNTNPLVINGNVIQPDLGGGAGGAVPQGGTGPNGPSGVPGVPPVASADPNLGNITPDGGGNGSTAGHARPGNDEPPQPSGSPSTPRPEAPGDVRLFCTDPQKAMCDEAARQLNRPEKDPTANRRRLFESLLAGAGKRSTDLGDSASDRRGNWFRVLDQLKASTASRESFLRSDIPGWKEEVKARVQASGLDQGTINQMKSKIDAINIVNMIDLVKTNRLSIDDFLSYCGSDGLSTGGYNDRNLIAMCPAHFTFLQETEGFARTLLHELGHSIDGDIFPSAHSKFEDCIKGEKFKAFKDQLGLEQDERQAELNAAETAARSVRNKTPREALSTIARFIGRYCPNVGGGAPALEATGAVARRQAEVFNPGGQKRHFGTDLMLQVLWGRNADLRQKMGCDRVSESLPMCSMQGIVTR